MEKTDSGRLVHGVDGLQLTKWNEEGEKITESLLIILGFVGEWSLEWLVTRESFSRGSFLICRISEM